MLYCHWLDDGWFSVTKRCESVNTMASFLWWIVGFYWVVSGGESLLQYAPRLYWYTLEHANFNEHLLHKSICSLIDVHAHKPETAMYLTMPLWMTLLVWANAVTFEILRLSSATSWIPPLFADSWLLQTWWAPKGLGPQVFGHRKFFGHKEYVC